mmetsp:Transcript_21429/g.32381  ORF Transcript_21429/g.32381 Transcript_21429/m.32381 type:complete len:306 (-) Transcript_21429:169-1086(-)
MPDELISVTSIKFYEKEQEDQGTLATSTATSFQRKASESSRNCDAILAFVALQVASIGLFASISSTCFCNYFHSSYDLEENETNGYGIWMVATDETDKFLACAPYPSPSPAADAPFDIHFHTSRAMSVFAPMSCFTAIAYSYFANAGEHSKQERRLYLSIFFMLVGAVMQGLTLMVMESNICHNDGRNTCGRSYGANMSIASATLMGVALFFLIIITGRRDVEYDTGRGDHVCVKGENGTQTTVNITGDSNVTERTPEIEDTKYSTSKIGEIKGLEDIILEDRFDGKEINERELRVINRAHSERS